MMNMMATLPQTDCIMASFVLRHKNVQRHKLVYMMLGDVMPKIHALQIKAQTPILRYDENTRTHNWKQLNFDPLKVL